MAMELNTISVSQNAATWMSDMQRWVESVKTKFSEYIRTELVKNMHNFCWILRIYYNFFCRCPTIFTLEEKSLIQHLKDEKTYVCETKKGMSCVLIFNEICLLQITPTADELSCILDHLEIAGDSPKLWATLSLELEAENSQRSETYWEKVRWQKSTE